MNDELRHDPEKGPSDTGYTRFGCRCDECRAAHSAAMRAYRRRAKRRRELNRPVRIPIDDELAGKLDALVGLLGTGAAGEWLGVTPRSVNRWSRGRRSTMPVEVADRLRKVSA